MITKCLLVVFATALAACVTRQNKTHETAAALSVYDLSPVSEKIQSWVDSNYYDGASIIVAKDNQVILEQYFGNYTPETQVYIASAGKWLAAAAIAAVVDEGRLSWDDKVVQWLPEFTDIKGQATLRQLLSHTAGYPDYQPKGKHPDDYQLLQDAVRCIVDLPADTTPGTAFHYGGLAMQVAGRMAELAAGQGWETLFQEKIAGPLGMTGTRFTPVDSTGGHNPMIGGGARGTLHDYAHFLEMILSNGMYGGKRILSEKAIAEMQADQVNGAAVSPGEYVEKARGLDHHGIYGLGAWREILDSQDRAVMISSPGWAGAYPWIDKQHNVYGFFLTHVNVAVAGRSGFSSFYASPQLPVIVRNILSGTTRRKLSSEPPLCGHPKLSQIPNTRHQFKP